jgi:hypothetical protein
MTRTTTATPILATLAALALALAACGGDDAGTGPAAETYAAQLGAAGIVGQTVTSAATGSATVRVDGGTLHYTIDLAGMTEVIAAHIHGPATPAQNADVIVTLFAPSSPTGMINGRLVGGTVASSQLEPGVTVDRVTRYLRSDSAFVMVHSTTYPDGEIRGHLARQ